MKTKKIILKVTGVLLLLFMLGFYSCEKSCWTCKKANAEDISACSESAKNIWESLDYVCVQDQ